MTIFSGWPEKTPAGPLLWAGVLRANRKTLGNFSGHDANCLQKIRRHGKITVVVTLRNSEVGWSLDERVTQERISPSSVSVEFGVHQSRQYTSYERLRSSFDG